MRRAGRVDGNHAEIVKALRSLPAAVLSLAGVGDGCPDLLVGFRGVNVLLEVKDPAQGAPRLTAAQVEFIATWPGPVYVVTDPDEAQRVVGRSGAAGHQGGSRMSYESPVYSVRRIPVAKVVANTWNPNSVAPPEMALLETSIWEDGYTMPVVCYYLADADLYEIVDGYHRYTVLKTSARIFEREQGMLPVVVIEKDASNRMASTIRHNRARGSHSIELMSNIVVELTRAGMSDAWILRHIGMDKEELLRLRQITGLADLFADREFSEAWSGAGMGPIMEDAE